MSDEHKYEYTITKVDYFSGMNMCGKLASALAVLFIIFPGLAARISYRQARAMMMESKKQF